MTTQTASQGLNHEVRAFAIGDVRIVRRDDSVAFRLSGYAAVFDKPTNIAGMFDEVIRHGAFRNAIASGQDVALLYNHNPFYLISACLMLYGLRQAFRVESGELLDPWALMAALWLAR